MSDTGHITATVSEEKISQALLMRH